MRVLILALVLVGCGSGKKEYRPLPPVSFQSPLEPPYVTVREGRPPYPVPRSEKARLKLTDKVILNVISKNKYLEEAAADLGSQAGYRVYVATTVSRRRVNVDKAGTLDDLAVELARAAKCKVSVDHLAREIRFVSGTMPRL